MNLIPEYPIDRDVELPPRGIWGAAIHRFDREQAAALRAAEAAGRPLLVRGSPGVGKSQLARAAAEAAGRRFIWVVVDGRTEAQDLMWRFDAVQRLADAQQDGKALREPAAYVAPGPLWAAFNWADASERIASAGLASPDWMGDLPPGQVPGLGAHSDSKVVVLIDEIDKADPDMPNALLEVMANDGFSVSVSGVPRVVCSSGQRPLIVITTNEERELPPAFLRRCFVITLALPNDPQTLRDHLVDLGERHQGYLVKCGSRTAEQKCAREVLVSAAECLLTARDDASRKQEYEPATAEYLDLVRALATLYPGDQSAQMEMLRELKTFALKKTLSDGR